MDGTMYRARRLLALVALAVIAPAAAGQSSTGESDVERRLREMQEELQTLRQDNQDMRQEIDELRAQTDDDWLTEKRATEIRNLVADVLADADTRASLLSDGMTAGWSDGFFLASPDGRFRLQLDGQIQVRWVYNFHDQPDRHRYGFEVTRTRLAFSGHVFSPDVSYMIKGDVSRQGQEEFGQAQLVSDLNFLLDAWVRLNIDDNWSVRFGQFKAPFMREELVDSSQQLVIERSLVNEALSVDRTQGIELTWAGRAGKLNFMFADSGLDQIGPFGLIGTAPLNPSNALVEDSEWTLVLRYEHLVAGNWRQFRDFTSPPGDDFGILLGAAAFWQRDEYGTLPPFPGFRGRDDREWVAWTVDASVEWGGANAFASFTNHYVDTPANNINIFGFVVQGGVYVDKKLEFFGRFEYAWYDFTNNALADLTVFTTGFNYYIDGQDLKWTTDIGFGISKIENAWASDLAGWRQELDGAEPQIVFRTQFQLLF